MNSKKDILSGLVFAIGDSFYLYFCRDIVPFTGKGTTPLTNQFMPLLWGSLMMVLSLTLILRGVCQLHKDAGEQKRESSELSPTRRIVEYREVILSFFVLFMYIFLLEKIGFIIMTALFLVAEINLLTPKEKRNYILSLAVGIGVSILLYCIFNKALHILLPTGIFGF